MAGYTVTAKDAALTAIGAARHLGQPAHRRPGHDRGERGRGGSYARVQTTWGTAAASSMAGSQVTINVPASTTIGVLGDLDARLGGHAFWEGGALPANETYGGAGTYAITVTLPLRADSG